MWWQEASASLYMKRLPLGHIEVVQALRVDIGPQRIRWLHVREKEMSRTTLKSAKTEVSFNEQRKEQKRTCLGWFVAVTLEIFDGHPTTRIPITFQCLFVNNSKIKWDNMDSIDKMRYQFFIKWASAHLGQVTDIVSFILSFRYCELTVTIPILTIRTYDFHYVTPASVLSVGHGEDSKNIAQYWLSSSTIVIKGWVWPWYMASGFKQVAPAASFPITSMGWCENLPYKPMKNNLRQSLTQNVLTSLTFSILIIAYFNIFNLKAINLLSSPWIYVLWDFLGHFF